MKYKFIDTYRSKFEVGKMCRALRVSRSGYYAWRNKPESDREKENEKLVAEIRDIHERSRHTYGSPRVHAELRDKGYRTGRNRVARLMREQRIRSKVKKKFKVTTHSKHGLPVAENLLKERDLRIHRPNQVWVSDITYIRSSEGWLYLCIVMDLYSRSIVGWSMEERLTKDLSATIATALILEFCRQGGLTAEEFSLAARLEREKYGHAEWTLRR